MRIPIYKKWRQRATPRLRTTPDSHQWATKMEIRRLLSGKPELKLNPEPKASN